MYLVFGVLTTVVGMGSYFLILFAARAFGVSTSSGTYNVIRIAAQIIQWVLAVLFAYYTNKKWVFEVKDTVKPDKELVALYTDRYEKSRKESKY